MSGIFETAFNLRTSDFDCRKKLLPGAVLDIFQEVAGLHSEALGVGLKDMQKNELMWVLVNVRYKVLKEPKLHQKVLVKTWPLPPDRISYRREYEILDEEGNTLILGSSEWVTVHSTRRRIMPAKPLYTLKETEFCSRLCFEEKGTKIKPFETQGDGFEICPRYCDIDLNGHVNNTKYANFVMDALSPERTIKAFQIDYHKEVFAGCDLKIHSTSCEDYTIALGKNGLGENMFTCKLEWE